MKTFTMLLMLHCLTISAEARLGDTPAKVAERYGKSTEIYQDVKGRISHIHHSDGWIIMVQYIGGTSQSEIYTKENDAALTESELQAKLSANTSGDKWEEIPKSIVTKASGPGWRMWLISRTGTMSAYGPCLINDRQFHHAISVGTRAHQEQNKILDEAKRKQ